LKLDMARLPCAKKGRTARARTQLTHAHDPRRHASVKPAHACTHARPRARCPQVGDSWPLTDGDNVEFGLATSARVTCWPAGPPPPAAGVVPVRARLSSSSNSSSARTSLK